MKIALNTLLALLTIAAVACSDSSDSNPSGFEEKVRPAPEDGTTAAYFLHVNNLDQADTLVRLSSDAALLTEVHEIFENERKMKGMRQIQQLIVGAGDSVLFKPGGTHIMLMQLNRTLSPADSVRLTMRWKQAGTIEKVLPVQP